jgi:hypothetical protein
MFLSTQKSKPFSDRAIFSGTYRSLPQLVCFKNCSDCVAFAIPRIWFEKFAFLTTLQPRRRSLDGWFSHAVAGISPGQHPAP